MHSQHRLGVNFAFIISHHIKSALTVTCKWRALHLNTHLGPAAVEPFHINKAKALNLIRANLLENSLSVENQAKAWSLKKKTLKYGYKKIKILSPFTNILNSIQKFCVSIELTSQRPSFQVAKLSLKKVTLTHRAHGCSSIPKALESLHKKKLNF